MKQKIAVALLAALLACTIAACAALAHTVTLAFGYELEVPEGVEITKDVWNPDSEPAYWIEGTYNDGEGHFMLKFVRETFSPDKDRSVWDERDEELFAERAIVNVPGGSYAYSASGLSAEEIGAIYAKMDAAAELFIDAGVFEARAKPQPEGEPQENAFTGLTATVVTRESPLGLRETPGNSGEVILQIPRGETVKVLKQGDWPLVEYDGQHGYVNGKYLEMNP